MNQSVETHGSAIGPAAHVYAMEPPRDADEEHADYKVTVDGTPFYTDEVQIHGAAVNLGSGETVTFNSTEMGEMVAVDRVYVDRDGDRRAVVELTQAASIDA